MGSKGYIYGRSDQMTDIASEFERARAYSMGYSLGRGHLIDCDAFANAWLGQVALRKDRESMPVFFTGWVQWYR